MKNKNIVFDIGNVILNFNIDKVLTEFTDIEDDRKFIYDNIFMSPEWSKYSLIDTGYITRDNAIRIVQDRTNHERDELIFKFWTTYNDYAFVDEKVIDIIKKIRKNNHKIYLLSNINPYTYNFINDTSSLFSNVDGYVLSYEEHAVKPYKKIYNILFDKYKINPSETIFFDDNWVNIKTGMEFGMKSVLVEKDSFKNLQEQLEKNEII